MMLAMRGLFPLVLASTLVALAPDASAQLATFEPPHTARAPTATLDAPLSRELDRQAAEANATTPAALVTFALGITAHALHFGLGHRTSLSFHPGEREANCVEYAELFATIVNREHGALDLRAWVVRSDARLFGQKLADPAWKDHDWVLVVVHDGDVTSRLYVDPTLQDMGLGWDISGAVHGEPRLP
jgi:hypothetical protein